MAKILDPLNDYQLLEEVSGGSLFFANVDTFGVEGTPTLENTAKPYIENDETGEPGVITGKPLNSVPRGDLDKNLYDNTSDTYYDPESTYEPFPEEEEDDEPASGDTNSDSGTTNP